MARPTTLRDPFGSYMISRMPIAVYVTLQLPRSRAVVCSLLLLAYAAVLAHELSHEYDEVDSGCMVCVAADRLDDVNVNGVDGPQSRNLISAVRIPCPRSVSSAELPAAASRGPPITG